MVYPTLKGTVLRAVTMDDSTHPQLHEPNLLPGTAGAQPTLLGDGNRLVLLLWRAKDRPVEISILSLRANGILMGSPRKLEILSECPVGAVTGSTGGDGTDIWVGRIQADGPDHGGLTEIVQYRLSDSGGEKIISRKWVTGVYARRRMTLLWSQEPGFSPDGRLYLIGSGSGPGPEMKDQYITMQVPYQDLGGWMYRRYEQPSFQSPSSAGACLFQNNIVYALRYGNDELHVSFFGNGCTPWPTGDFDDIGHLRDYGLSHSIREIPPK
jgi:hypothetical protein